MLDKILRNTMSWIVTVCAMSLVAWVFVITAYVISRLFGQGWLFVEEFTGYGLIWLAFLPLAYGLLTETHIKISIITNRIPARARSITQLINDVLALIIVAWLLYRSIDWVIRGVTQNIHSESRFFIIMWPIYLGISIGLALLTLALALKLGKRLKSGQIQEDGKVEQE